MFLVDTYGMGKATTGIMMVGIGGAAMYLARNRGFFLKIICPPVLGVTCGTSASAMYLINNVKRAVDDGRLNREMPDSITKDMIIINCLPISQEEKNVKMQRYFEDLENGRPTPI